MKIQIIIGSTRHGRHSHKLAQWVANQAKALESVETELVDLADYPLALFDEAISPQYNPNRAPEGVTKKWLDKVAEADAYVLVSPEYNRSTSGVLKNALDFIDFQMAQKPVLLVTHGSTGGAQAVSHLRGIVPGLHAITIPTAVYFSARVSEVIDEEGELIEAMKTNPHGPQAALSGALESLSWYAQALSVARKNS